MKLIPQLDAYPSVVRLAQTTAGKVLMWILFAIGLAGHHFRGWLDVACILALILLVPRFRTGIIALAALYRVLFRENWIEWDLIGRVAGGGASGGWWNSRPMQYACLAAVFLFFVAFWSLSRRPGKSLITRRPVMTLLLLYGSVLLAVSLAPLPAAARLVLWTFLVVAGPYLWFCAYSLEDRHVKHGDSFPLQLRAWYPIWGAAYTSATPIPKGAAYLRRVESKTPGDLAVTQLKGLKLLYWALMLHIVLIVFQAAAYGDVSGPLAAAQRFSGWTAPSFHLPTLDVAIARVATGDPCPWYLCWCTLFTHLVEMLLTFGSFGNCAVACCRMAGYRALRFTYRPLEAGSLAEFWNRYHYYFKELLVEFFFYPVYLKYFKKHPRLRLAAATFAAACWGNALFHFLRGLDYVAVSGLPRAVIGFQTYLFYSVVLASSIVVSQLRTRKQPLKEMARGRRILATVPALLFFCILEIFDHEDRTRPLVDCFAFLGQMFLIGGNHG
jgi:hypothetical protein